MGFQPGSVLAAGTADLTTVPRTLVDRPPQTIPVTGRHTTADIGEPTTFCTFQEVLRSDAEDEEYEAAVLKWIYGYNAYERLGSALDATVGSLWQEMRDTGEFPVDAGVDALRAWAFVIARAHDKSASLDTTLVANEELPLILEAIRCHPASGINDLPPLPPSQRT